MINVFIFSNYIILFIFTIIILIVYAYENFSLMKKNNIPNPSQLTIVYQLHNTSRHIIVIKNKYLLYLINLPPLSCSLTI